MNSKDKANLSYLYELDQYKSLEKLCKDTRKKIAEQLLVTDMTTDNAERHVAFLQGQAFAISSLLVKVREIHKASMKSD